MNISINPDYLNSSLSSYHSLSLSLWSECSHTLTSIDRYVLFDYRLNELLQDISAHIKEICKLCLVKGVNYKELCYVVCIFALTFNS